MATERTKVLQIITRLIVGGAQETALLTCALADPDRFEMVLVTGPETGPEGSLHDEARDRGVRLEVVPTLRRAVSPWHDVRAYRALCSLIDQERPKVVHTHSSKVGIIGRAAAQHRKTPVVVHTVHGWSFHDHMNPVVRRGYIAGERWAAPKADRLVLVAETDRAKGLREGIGSPGQYELIRSGIELDAFRQRIDRHELRRELGIPEAAPVLGSVMRLSPQKDPMTFVAIAARVLRVLPEAHAILAGDGPLAEAVAAAAADEGIADRLHLLGLRRDVELVFGALDAFVLTSLWEGLPRTLVQAAAAGLPIVASRADGVSDIVGRIERSGLFDPGDVEGASKQLIAVLEGERATSRASDDVLEDYDASKMVTRLCDLYTSLL